MSLKPRYIEVLMSPRSSVTPSWLSSMTNSRRLKKLSKRSCLLMETHRFSSIRFHGFAAGLSSTAQRGQGQVAYQHNAKQVVTCQLYTDLCYQVVYWRLCTPDSSVKENFRLSTPLHSTYRAGLKPQRQGHIGGPIAQP